MPRPRSFFAAGERLKGPTPIPPSPCCSLRSARLHDCSRITLPLTLVFHLVPCNTPQPTISKYDHRRTTICLGKLARFIDNDSHRPLSCRWS
ncbi:unnamed protein product [Sympodiomycopsis kandeliae]